MMVNTTIDHPQLPTQLLIQARMLKRKSFIPGYSLLNVVQGSSGTGS